MNYEIHILLWKYTFLCHKMFWEHNMLNMQQKFYKWHYDLILIKILLCKTFGRVSV